MSKNYEQLLFKALCQEIRYNQEIGVKNNPTMHNMAGRFARVTSEDQWFQMGADSAISRKFYAIAYSLERTGLIEIVKGNNSNTRMKLSAKGWAYIRTLRAKA